MHSLTKQFNDLTAKIQNAMAKLNIAADQKEAKNLTAQTEQPGFWDDPSKAAETSQRLASLQKHIDSWTGLLQRTLEAVELANLEDPALAGELEKTFRQLSDEYAAREFELKLSGPYDKQAAILQIQSGAGGTDAQDWAEMLLRMYLRWCERQGMAAAVVDQSAGEEAGIKSATVEVNGPFAFGRLKSEKGVHRLVRLSPFNADSLRQTSFAQVDVLPQIPELPEFEIDPKDLRVDVFRSGGHGGQSVNTTDSAVRLTHLPTRIVVSIQNERSQLQNKEKAMAILRARLADLMLEQHKAKISELKGQPQATAWGNQIRSYVLHPYTKVKDHRTNHETSLAQAVLDGDIDDFIEAYLAHHIGQTS
jgi:peptide chain release factor 2